ncbi:hypothetical protein OF377_01450 [Ureaplasma sp. ES3154-GEN]|uniref:hypothetical protein n=1 Tax=Ureaplasma sp. ES3154-GEN TaxID=2984844 RepID=UPI0021E7F136|nr:hypothetical protein [Ureaplasma sp. ES3154-GEN]MCV3743552.1 hypothetical protein [Ureaplasma sp. ES3154-GEN]
MRKKRFIHHLLYSTPVVLSPLITLVISAQKKDIYLDESLSYVWRTGDINDRFSSLLSEDWMAQIPNNRSIFSLSIPATHDSTMYSYSGIYGFFGQEYALTQAYNFRDQLRLGIRGFDLRMQNDGRLVHGIVPSKQTLDDAMRDVTTFLAKHPSEFVIIRIKDENFNVNKDYYARQANAEYQRVLNKYRNYLYNPNGLQKWQLKNTSNFNVESFRGKVIFLNHWHHIVNQDLTGGFLYDNVVDRRNTLQDNYDGINDPNHKAQIVQRFMQKTNNRPYDEELFYLNFMSYASRTRPFVSSRDVNPLMTRYLKTQNALGSLGIVFMDFPGPSIIQAIYRTNFYYSDDYINHNGLGPLMTNLQISTQQPIYDYDQEITLDTSDNPNAYQNAIIEVYDDDRLLQTVNIPTNFNQQKFNIVLQANHPVHLGMHLRLVAYKKTPDNGWFIPRKYNNLTLDNISIAPTQYHNEKNTLIADISLMQSYYLENYSIVSNYLTTAFIDALNTLHSNSNANQTTFIKIKNRWNLLKPALDELLEHLYKLEDNYNQLTTTNYQAVFNEENTRFLSNLKTSINNEINTLFLNQTLTSMQIEQINQKVQKYALLAKNIAYIVDDINFANFDALQSSYQHKFTWLLDSKNDWDQKIATWKILLIF